MMIKSKMVLNVATLFSLSTLGIAAETSSPTPFGKVFPYATETVVYPVSYRSAGVWQTVTSDFPQRWQGTISSQQVPTTDYRRIINIQSFINVPSMDMQLLQSTYWIYTTGSFFDITMSLEEGSPTVGKGYCIQDICHTDMISEDGTSEVTYSSDSRQIKVSGSSTTEVEKIIWNGSGYRSL